MQLKNRKVTVVGIGNSGLNAAVLLNSMGADVWATDLQDTPSTRKNKAFLESRGVKVEVGIHTDSFIKASELVVVSPGVEADSTALVMAERHNVPVVGEMEIGFRFCKGAIIAITGTNGKSTVTALIGEILKDAGKDVVVCGNIGNSLSGEIGRIKKDTLVVLEVSSFQLERIEKFKPHIAVILNITDDHLDRYDKFTDYFLEKLKVFSNQDGSDILILNYDAENLRPLEAMARSKVMFYSRTKDGKNPYIECMKLKGDHNAENVMASALVGKICGVSEDSMKKTIAGFRGLPHRCETVGIVDGIEYVDDSKGTTVDSTRRALDSCNGPVILIAGGKDKFSDYSAIRDAVSRKVKHLVLIGEAKDSIRNAIGDCASVREAKDMPEAVRVASGLAVKGDMVLLSPMCSSFDMFRDYKERGEVFKKAVESLKGSRKAEVRVQA